MTQKLDTNGNFHFHKNEFFMNPREQRRVFSPLRALRRAFRKLPAKSAGFEESVRRKNFSERCSFLFELSSVKQSHNGFSRSFVEHSQRIIGVVPEK